MFTSDLLTLTRSLLQGRGLRCRGHGLLAECLLHRGLIMGPLLLLLLLDFRLDHTFHDNILKRGISDSRCIYGTIELTSDNRNLFMIPIYPDIVRAALG